MKTNSNLDSEDALLDALLGDETWQAASTTFKAAALRTFQARQRGRRLTRWAGSVVALAVAMLAVAHWCRRPPSAPRQFTMAPAQVPKSPGQRPSLTDAELVATFPKGSCFIAEVDGRKELIFFNPKDERAYLARPGASGH